jgi:hypothetical protein
MTKWLLMEEFHLTVYVPEGLRPAEYATIRRKLDSGQLRSQLEKAARKVFRRYRALTRTRVSLTRCFLLDRPIAICHAARAGKTFGPWPLLAQPVCLRP